MSGSRPADVAAPSAGTAGGRTATKAILMIAYHYPPESSSSGTLRTLKFSRYLPASGWLPHVLTLNERAYRVRDEALLAQVPPESVVHRVVGVDLASRLSIRGRYPGMVAVPDRFVSWLPFGVARGLRIVRSSAVRALYSTSPLPTAHLIALVLRRRTGIPWVADFRDPWIEEGLYPRPGSWRAWLEPRLERAVIRAADRITVTTTLFRQEILRRYPEVPDDKVRVVFNGYDEDDFEGIAEPPRTARFEILHAGLVTPDYRDPRPFLTAVAGLTRAGRLPREHVRVVFLGGGRYLDSAEFRGFLERLGLTSVVDVAGRIPYRDGLRRLFRASALLLLQASDDTRYLIPAKTFEYLRVGRPVLALTTEGATADLLAAVKWGAVRRPDDVPGIEAALVELYAARRAAQRSTVPPDIARYERRRLTAELASILDELLVSTGRQV